MGLSGASEKEGERGMCRFTCCPEALGPCEKQPFSLEESGQDSPNPSRGASYPLPPHTQAVWGLRFTGGGDRCSKEKQHDPGKESGQEGLGILVCPSSPFPKEPRVLSYPRPESARPQTQINLQT